MSELSNLLLQHYKRYPKMEALDCLKLIYQNEFGCGHLISDKSAAFRFLEEELRSIDLTADSDSSMESIGNGYTRVPLSIICSNMTSKEALFRLFVLSANPDFGSHGCIHSFLEKCEELLGLCRSAALPFMQEEIADLIRQAKDDNFQPFRHSVTYWQNYKPSYRVVRTSLLPLLPLLEVKEHLSDSACYLIAIDGRCASGKTTLAKYLADVLDAFVIHLDDFFLPPEKRTAKRFSEPGGNIDYERFSEEVAGKLACPDSFSYHKFDCETFTSHETIEVPAGVIRIVEGVYSLRPEWQPLYQSKIILDITQDEQLRRIQKRDGAEQLIRFQKQWIPLEEVYFESNKRSCDEDTARFFLHI